MNMNVIRVNDTRKSPTKLGELRDNIVDMKSPCGEKTYVRAWPGYFYRGIMEVAQLVIQRNPNRPVELGRWPLG